MSDVILMVEDNSGDVQIIRRQLQHSALQHELHVVASGREAIDHLSQLGNRASAFAPCLVLIDLQVPGVDGFALIEWIRRNSQTREIPIVVYSGTVTLEEAERAYALGANAYFAKLSGAGQYNLLFTAIQEFCKERHREKVTFQPESPRG